MKKLAILMSGILATLFFLMVFFSLGNETRNTVIDFNSYLKSVDFTKEKGIQLFIDENQIENEELQSYLYTVFQKYHAIAIGVMPPRGTELQSIICYVYSDEDIYKDQFYTKDKKRIKLSSASEEQYYTINKKDKNGVLIEFLNPMYYSFSTPYEIHPFHQAIGKRMPILLNIVGISNEEFTKEIANTQFSNYIINIEDLNDDKISYVIHDEGIQFDSEKLMYICGALAFVSLMMLIVVEIIKNKKHIAVAKLNGIGKFRIMRKIIFLFLSCVFLAYTATLLVLLYLVSGPYRDVNKSLYHIVLLTILIFFAILILLGIFLYVYLRMYVNFHELKKNKINSFSINLNIIVKVMMTSILILPFTSLAVDTYEQLKETVAMYQTRNVNKNRYLVNVLEDNKSQSADIFNENKNEDIYTKTYSLLSSKYNGKAYDMSNWLVRYHDNEEEYEVPLIVVNRNYLKDYGDIYEYESKEVINVDQLTGGVMLVPKGYEESKSLQNYKGQLKHQRVIITEKMQKEVKPLWYSEESYTSEYDKNPIIYVMDETDPDTHDWVIMYIDQKDLTNLTKDLKELNLEKNIQLQSLLPEVELDYNRHLITFTTMAFMMIGYLSVYLAFVYQSIYVYLDVHRKRLAVQYLQGYSYRKRYLEIYLLNMCAYVLAGSIAVLLVHASIKDVILYILFFGCVEVLFEAYQIRRFEKKSSIRSLK